MSSIFEIRADYDRETIVMYQAYSKVIADAALREQKFVPPFSFGRMTWIKPSFLWLMERSNWGQKSGQQYILAVRITQEGFKEALNQAVLTSPEKKVYRSSQEWQEKFNNAKVHVQWDPERSIRGKKLEHRSIQIGISRHLIEHYVKNWIVEIKDDTPLTKKLHRLCKEGRFSQAQKLLPKEKIFTLEKSIGKKIGL